MKGTVASSKNSKISGFSLIEMLVVLVIVGFVVSMVSVRFSEVSGNAAKTVGKTNMARLLGYLTDNLQHNGKYPRGMVNIISMDDNGNYYKPTVSDRDPKKPEVLCADMDERHRMSIHYLNKAEAKELRRLGVVQVYSHNSPNDPNPKLTSHTPHMELVDAGVAVLMTGGGAPAANQPIVAAKDEANRAHPDQLFRILLGVGPECELVKNGNVFNAPRCPESQYKPVNYDWQYYSVLIPRLRATEQRLRADKPLGGVGELAEGMVQAYGIRASTADSSTLSTVRKRIVDAFEHQHYSFFDVMDARGNTRADSDMVGWGLDFNNDGKIGSE